MVWPDGKENRSGGKMCAQQCGWISHGRLRPDVFLSKTKIPIPITAAEPAAAVAVNRSAGPNSKITNPTRYQSQPSPARVAAIAAKRTHFGAGHLFTLRISL